ncbi:fumarylacetoacetate hydrolase family protein, partial [Actinomadura sp. SCN-SB]|uniref:fumarylacetoacetate hydrolase family protein n=1 Tax=Actinomadura sp. SCN-SB TaxID=3373092 RepID=UPI0037532B77
MEPLGGFVHPGRAPAQRHLPSRRFWTLVAWSRQIAIVDSIGLWFEANGVHRQNGNTKTMISDPFTVHHLSRFMVLEPDDLINTGTPPRVGMGHTPSATMTTPSGPASPRLSPPRSAIWVPRPSAYPVASQRSCQVWPGICCAAPADPACPGGLCGVAAWRDCSVR